MKLVTVNNASDKCTYYLKTNYQTNWTIGYWTIGLMN